MSFLLSLPPFRRRCFARVASDCRCKVISHSDDHSIVKVHWRVLSTQGVAGGVRGEYPTSKIVFNLFISLTNWRIFWEFGKKLFDIPTFNCLFPFGNGALSGFCPFTYSDKGRSLRTLFSKYFFAQNTKTAEKPDKQGVFSGKIFLKFFLFDCKKAENRL